MHTTYLSAKDLFCGFGGWTTAAKVLDIDVRRALNHWAYAINVHHQNHPKTSHYLGDVRNTHPNQHPTTRIFLGSPSCTDFSQAKGVHQDLERQGQMSMFDTNPDEVERMAAAEQSRATMRDVIRFAEYHKYEMMFIENVVEVHKWSEFDRWAKDLSNLGYNLKFMYLNSMFFHQLNDVENIPPAPQSRDRWYCVAVRKGIPMPDLDFQPLAPCPRCEKDVRAIQVWKNPRKQWGKYGIAKGQYYYGCPVCFERKNKRLRPLPVEPYYFAAINCVDMNIPIQKIGDPARRQKVSANTRKRVEAAMKKYGAHPIIIHNQADHDGLLKYRSALLNPLYTQPASNNFKIAIPHVIQKSRGTLYPPTKSAIDPMYTQVSSANYKIMMADSAFGHKVVPAEEGPLRTQTRQDTHGIVMIDLSRPGKSHDGHIRSGNDPMPTQTTKGTQSVIVFTTYNGNPTTKTHLHPLPTIATKDRIGMAQYEIPLPAVDDVYYRTLRSLWRDEGAGENGETIVRSEIRTAMGFPSDYDIDNVPNPTVANTTRGFGGAITPGVGYWLIKRGIKVLA